MSRIKGLFLLEAESFPKIYGPVERSAIEERVEIVSAEPITRDSLAASMHLFHEVEVIFSGWGAPIFDKALLNAAPQLKAIFYGGGGTGGSVTEEVWNREILISSAYAANAVPVAEYCLAITLLSLKHAWGSIQQTRRERRFPARRPVPGAYGSTVGLVSMGATARAFRKLLRNVDVEVLAYDPFLSAADGDALEVRLCSLEELFRSCDVVSVHTPSFPETHGLITGSHIASMRPGATLINTARGEILREAELIQVLQQRTDLQAILDVTWPEPPRPDSPLFDLPNVVVTPHIAGSLDAECRRMGRMMVEELERYLAGKPLMWSISPALAANTIHRPVDRRVSLSV